MEFDVLLAKIIEKFAHLLRTGVISLLVPLAAGTVLVMLPVVGVHKMFDDSFHLRAQAFL